MEKRVLISAGDPSGDLILSKIISEIQALHPEVRFSWSGLCGPHCQSLGAVSLASSKDVAVVGIVEVLRHLPKIFSVLDVLSRQLDKVDSLLCIDFPDFNLKLAGMAEKKKVPVDFVIAPQVWAWRKGRLPYMRRVLRRLYPALPFEEQIFFDAGVDARFMGHPLRDVLPPRNRRQARAQFSLKENDFTFCIMAGSRHSEIHRHLPLFIEGWNLMKKLRSGDRHSRLWKDQTWKALLPLAPGWTEQSWFESLAKKHHPALKKLLESGEWTLVEGGQAHQIMMASDFGWLVSGTATLEAAYYQLPHVLVYKLSWLSAKIIQSLTSYFTEAGSSAALPNLLLGKKVIPELLQDFLNPRRLAIETLEILNDPIKLNDMKLQLRWLPKKMGEHGATKRIAQDLCLAWGLESPR